MFYSLPNIAESQFASYIASGFSNAYVKQTATGEVSGSYSVIRAFSVEPFTAPFVMVEAVKFSEREPFSHVYKGTLSFTVTTQIDDDLSPIETHDSAVAKIYDLISNQSAVYSGVNASNFHLWGYFNTSYEQGLAENKDMGRCLATRLEYQIEAQTLGIG